MLDYLHIPDNPNGTIDYFPGFSSTNGGSWVVWEKPKASHMIRITCIAGGGGGGSGFSSDNTGSRYGGGGGGSSAISIVTIPAYVLPDRLYISSGIGGDGGAANPPDQTGNSGSAGICSYVSIAPDIGGIYCVCFADSGKGGGGGLPVGGNIPQGGIGGSVATMQNMLLASHGIRDFVGGQNGIFAGATGITLLSQGTGLLLTGGTGGGINTGVSGVVNIPTQSSFTILYNLTLPTGSGRTGLSGREIYQPFLSTGGTGGNANTGTGPGGNGGAGGFGSGGGGGGAGGAGAAGGGGKGGNGLVIIHTW